MAHLQISVTAEEFGVIVENLYEVTYGSQSEERMS